MRRRSVLLSEIDHGALSILIGFSDQRGDWINEGTERATKGKTLFSINSKLFQICGPGILFDVSRSHSYFHDIQKEGKYE